MKVIKSKQKTKRENDSKKRKVSSYEQRYSMNLKPHKTGILENSPGLYNGNYGERNSNLVNQNTFNVNIGGGTFNQSTKVKENLLSKSVGLEGIGKNHNFGSMKSKSIAEKMNSMKKFGPIKATISTEKVGMSKYEHLSSKYSGSSQNKPLTQPQRREKRPHSSTFIGNSKQDMIMYHKIMGTKIKSKNKSMKLGNEGK